MYPDHEHTFLKCGLLEWVYFSKAKEAFYLLPAAEGCGGEIIKTLPYLCPSMRPFVMCLHKPVYLIFVIKISSPRMALNTCMCKILASF